MSLSALQNIVDHNSKTQETKLEALAKPCPFCNKRLAKYMCPQCKQGYCSIDCFRSKGHDGCSGGFYKEQVRNEVGGIKGDEDEKKRMVEMLRKYEFMAPENGGALEFVGDPEAVIADGLDDEEGDEESGDPLREDNEDEDEGNEEDESEEEDEETIRRRKDLELRMTGLNIEEADFEEIWDRLDPREREEFVKLAQELEKEERGGATKLQE